MVSILAPLVYLILVGGGGGFISCPGHWKGGGVARVDTTLLEALGAPLSSSPSFCSGST